MSKWIEKRTRPVLPLYLAALTWPVASLILPPYRLVNLVIIAALSTVVYLVSSRFCPTRVQRVEQPYATGSRCCGIPGGQKGLPAPCGGNRGALPHGCGGRGRHAERHCRQPGRAAQAE